MTGSVTSVATGPITGSVPNTGCWARTGLASNVLVMIGAGWMVLMAAGWWTWVCSAIGMVWWAIFGVISAKASAVCTAYAKFPPNRWLAMEAESCAGARTRVFAPAYGRAAPTRGATPALAEATRAAITATKAFIL